MDKKNYYIKMITENFFGKKFSHKKIGKKLPRKEQITEKNNTRKNTNK